MGSLKMNKYITFYNFIICQLLTRTDALRQIFTPITDH